MVDCGINCPQALSSVVASFHKSTVVRQSALLFLAVGCFIPKFQEKLSCGLPALPRLVVMRITPLAPLTPYTAVADASFNTDIDSISLGSRLLRSRSTPSTSIKGALFRQDD